MNIDLRICKLGMIDILSESIPHSPTHRELNALAMHAPSMPE